MANTKTLILNYLIMFVNPFSIQGTNMHTKYHHSQIIALSASIQFRRHSVQLDHLCWEPEKFKYIRLYEIYIKLGLYQVTAGMWKFHANWNEVLPQCFRIKQTTMKSIAIMAEAVNVMQIQHVNYYIIQNY
jgi:hypothetical protein